MKKTWIIIIIIIIIIGAGYIGRHRINAMFGMGNTPTSTPSSNTAMTSNITAMKSNSAPTDNIYLTKTDPTKGKYLTDFQNMTLYTFDKDTSGISNCSGACLKVWPIYTSGATAEKVLPANISVITRPDGSKQFAWKNMPLYYFSSDSKAGDLKGDGVGGFWHIVKM